MIPIDTADFRWAWQGLFCVRFPSRVFIVSLSALLFEAGS